MASISSRGAKNHHTYELTLTEKSTSVANNTSSIDFSFDLIDDSNWFWSDWGSAITYTLWANGSEIASGSIPEHMTKNQNITSGSFSVPHNSDGSKSIEYSFSVEDNANQYYTSGNASESGTMTLTKIPRYLTINSFNISNITETTAIVSWSVSDPRTSTYYSLDGGTTWIGSATHGESVASDNKSGSFNITGLSAGTNYNIKIKIKRTDNDLWTESSSKSFSTYNFPYCNSTPDFTIGNKVNIGLYNPLGRNCTVAMFGADGSTIYSGNGWTGTSVGEFVTDTIISNLYKSIPSAKNGKYKIVVTYGSSSKTKDGGTYSIKGTEVPTINGFDYIDNNSSIVAITGDNTKIVQNKSILLVRFHEATPNFGAGGISQYYIECNGKKANGDKAGAYSLGTIDSSNNVDLTLTVVDKRGLSASKTIKVSMLSYSAPAFSTYLERLNNYEDETYLKVDGSVSSVNGKNKIEVLQYRYKVSGGSYGDYVSIEDNKQYTLNLSKNNAFVFEIIIKDTIGTTTVDTVPLGKGVFPLFIDTALNSVGINCFPTKENSLEVSGFDLCNVNRAIKGILLGSSDGLTIEVNSFGTTDKIPIIIAGADNASMIPVFTIIHARSGSGFGHINLGLDSTITRDGNRFHISAGQWSYFYVIVPFGCEITLSNSKL